LAILKRFSRMNRVNRLTAGDGSGCSVPHLGGLGLRRGWLLVGIVLVFVGVAVQAQSASEYQVKAAFLFNFTKFVEWPADAFSSANAPLQICVLGQDPFDNDFEPLIAGKTVNGHKIELSHPDGISQAKACHVLFVALTKKREIEQVLQNLKDARVLTVGDTAGFVQMGGMINFVLDDNRVRFEINLKAAELAHLKLSARLLTVAKLILGKEDPGTN
jgi:hypothetical protein